MTECPECGMPVNRGRTTSIDLDEESETYGEEYDCGGYVYWSCAGLMGKGPGSAACKRIAELKALLEAAEQEPVNADAIERGEHK